MKILLAFIASSLLAACGSSESESQLQINQKAKPKLCGDLSASGQSVPGVTLTDKWGKTVSVQLSSEASEAWIAEWNDISQNPRTSMPGCVSGPAQATMIDGILTFTSDSGEIFPPTNTGGVEVGNQPPVTVEPLL